MSALSNISASTEFDLASDISSLSSSKKNLKSCNPRRFNPSLTRTTKLQAMKYFLNAFLTGAFFVASVSGISAQDGFDHTSVGHFDKLVLGLFVEAKLEQGSEESVSVKYHGVHPDELVVREAGKTLEIYLEHARYWEKQRKVYHKGWKESQDWYDGGWVEVIITYRDLDEVVIKGEEDVTFGPMTTDKLKIKGYGALDIEFQDIIAEKLKVKLYGENEFECQEGTIASQRYKLFGENTIDVEDVVGEQVKVSNFGESEIMTGSETLKFTVFGELDISCPPGTNIRKGVVLGEYSVGSW